jgi:hypothetical protein
MPIQQKSTIWENLGKIYILFCFDQNFNFLHYNQHKNLLTECHKAHSNLLPKFHFSIWHMHNFIYSAKISRLLSVRQKRKTLSLLRQCLMINEPASDLKKRANVNKPLQNIHIFTH